MTLAFLTADAAEVVARSPMEREARAAGARLEVRAGWSVALDYGDAEGERELVAAGVGFVDRSHLLKLELHGEAGAVASAVAGSGLAPGQATRGRDAWWCRVTPARVLVLGEPEAAAGIRDAVARATAASADRGLVTVVDVTSGLAALTLAGPGARELLARFCALDVRPAAMPVGAFRPGSVARTPGYVLREREDRLLVLVGSALGSYLWTVVADAAGRLGGGPVGVEALRG